jgi:hypothetical protein
MSLTVKGNLVGPSYLCMYLNCVILRRSSVDETPISHRFSVEIFSPAQFTRDPNGTYTSLQQ